MNEIEHRDRARQIMSFDNMKRRWNLRPTDIDTYYVGNICGFQEYRSKLFIYIEGKLKGTPWKQGQRWSFEAICDSYYEHDTEPKSLSKHFAWVIFFEHEVKDTNKDVIVGEQHVTEVISSVTLAWHSPDSLNVVPKFNLNSNGKITVIEAIIQIENWCHENKILIGKED